MNKTELLEEQAVPAYRLVSRDAARGPDRCSRPRGGVLRALETEELGRSAVPLLEALGMFNVSLATDGEARSLEPAHAELHPIEGHEETDPPSFEYVEPARLQFSMWKLAAEMELLDRALREPAADPAAQQHRVAEILVDLESAVRGIAKPGSATQHPLLNRHLPRFRAQVRRAREDAERTPPNYFTATTLVGSCSACPKRWVLTAEQASRRATASPTQELPKRSHLVRLGSPAHRA